MINIKILSIEMINFKGFENKTIFFNNANSVILGGKNGFGKTTIFDAVELAFTNQIKRLSNYEGLHDKKLLVSGENFQSV
ncbi:AAA family ATPase [Hallerella succinigenes]|uniref:AAA domain-containing protein n=1 Tax=Hallerella succinigenes TaxID=1896222 RepID=A0A2M9A6N3_9BACT|nr:AAA family ATPase [Hallerella succinigenes]PJJ41381.1 AAA domain-containing protein [Hallerella succinigenes]